MRSHAFSFEYSLVKDTISYTNANYCIVIGKIELPTFIFYYCKRRVSEFHTGNLEIELLCALYPHLVNIGLFITLSVCFLLSTPTMYLPSKRDDL